MSRRHKKQALDGLQPIDSDDEQIRSTERQLLHRNYASPVLRPEHLPPLLPPVSRGLDSDEIAKGQKHIQHRREFSGVKPCRLPPLCLTASRDIDSKRCVDSSDVQHKHNGKSKTKKRHKKKDVQEKARVATSERENTVHDYPTSATRRKEKKCNGDLNDSKKYKTSKGNVSPKVQEHVEEIAKLADTERSIKRNKVHRDGETIVIGDKSLNGKEIKRSTKKDSRQKRREKTVSISDKKPNRLKPLNEPLQARKMRQNLLDAPEPLPDINISGFQDVCRLNETGSKEVSDRMSDINADSVEIERENTTRLEDDIELMKELRLDLSFLYTKEELEKPTKTRIMDISLRDSDSDSLESTSRREFDQLSDSDQSVRLAYERLAHCQNALDDNIEQIEFDGNTTDRSEDDSLEDFLFEDEEIPIMSPRCLASNTSFPIKPK